MDDPGRGHFSNNPQWAYSGSEYAYLVVWPEDNYSRLDRTFYLPSQNWRSCRVAINVRAVNNDAYVILTARKAGAATGAQQGLTLRPSQGWVAMQVFLVPAEWGQLTHVTVFLHRSPANPVDIRVDDLRAPSLMISRRCTRTSAQPSATRCPHSSVQIDRTP